MSDDVDDTADLKAPEVAAADRQEGPTSRWNGTGERVRRHPIGVAVGAGIAGLLIGGILGAGLFGGSAPEVGRAGASSHYAADGPQCLGGPPPPRPVDPEDPVEADRVKADRVKADRMVRPAARPRCSRGSRRARRPGCRPTRARSTAGRRCSGSGPGHSVDATTTCRTASSVITVWGSRRSTVRREPRIRRMRSTAFQRHRLSINGRDASAAQALARKAGFGSGPRSASGSGPGMAGSSAASVGASSSALFSSRSSWMRDETPTVDNWCEACRRQTRAWIQSASESRAVPPSGHSPKRASRSRVRVGCCEPRG